MPLLSDPSRRYFLCSQYVMTAVVGETAAGFCRRGPRGGARVLCSTPRGTFACGRLIRRSSLPACGPRAHAAAADGGKNSKLTFISLPKLIAQVRHLREQQQPIPQSLQYLGGMTRLQYVFIFPDDHDLMIAGPAEPWQVVPAPVPIRRICGGQEMRPAGAATGGPDRRAPDGSRQRRQRLRLRRLDPSPDSVQKAEQVERRILRQIRAQRMNAHGCGAGPAEACASSARGRIRGWLSCAWRRITS